MSHKPTPPKPAEAQRPIDTSHASVDAAGKVTTHPHPRGPEDDTLRLERDGATVPLPPAELEPRAGHFVAEDIGPPADPPPSPSPSPASREEFDNYHANPEQAARFEENVRLGVLSGMTLKASEDLARKLEHRRAAADVDRIVAEMPVAEMTPAELAAAVESKIGTGGMSRLEMAMLRALGDSIEESKDARRALDEMRLGIKQREAVIDGADATPDQQHDLEVEIGRLTHRAPTPAQVADMIAVAEDVKALARTLIERVPRGRERALCFTALQDIRIRANAGIVLDAPKPKGRPS